MLKYRGATGGHGNTRKSKASRKLSQKQVSLCKILGATAVFMVFWMHQHGGQSNNYSFSLRKRVSATHDGTLKHSRKNNYRRLAVVQDRKNLGNVDWIPISYKILHHYKDEQKILSESREWIQQKLRFKNMLKTKSYMVQEVER